MKDNFTSSIALTAVLIIVGMMLVYQTVTLNDLQDRTENLLANMLAAEQEASYWKAEADKYEDYFRMEQKKLHLLIDAMTPDEVEIRAPKGMECAWDMCGCLHDPIMTDNQKEICEESGLNRWYAMQVVCMADDNCMNCMTMSTEGGMTFPEAAAWCYKYALYP
jgi:hypothetical protein